jgi:hypothetical protein
VFSFIRAEFVFKRFFFALIYLKPNIDDLEELVA